MKQLFTKKGQDELKSCEQKLQFFKQENAFLKYRLSEMVDVNEGEKFLQAAEYFQNELLQKDARLQNLVARIHGIEESLETNNSYASSSTLQVQQKEIQKEIAAFEFDFLDLTKQFNEKLCNRKGA